MTRHSRSAAQEAVNPTPRDTRPAAIYARVSTEDQAKGFSLPTQVEACQKLAKREGYTVPEHQILMDDGISGMTLERPGLRQLRELVSATAITAVIVYDPDRLSRNLGHQLLLAEECERAGVKLLIVSHPMEQGPEGWLFFQMRGALAECERAKILERTTRGRRGRAQAGHPLVGACPPLGYDLVKDAEHPRGHLVINAEEAAVVRHIFDLCLAGHGGQAIARRLTAEGILTKSDRLLRARQAAAQAQGRDPATIPSLHRKAAPLGTWCVSNIRRLLRSPVYKGELFYNKRQTVQTDPARRRVPRNPHRLKTTATPRPRDEWIALSVPPIIDAETWAQAQAAIDAHITHNPRSRMTEYLLLNGRLKCGYCGLSMGGFYRKGGKRRYRRYRCGSFRHRLQRACGGSIDADVIERRAWQYVELLLRRPETLEHLLAQRQAQAQPERDSLHHSLEAVAAQLAKCATEAQRWEHAYAEGVIDLAHFKRLRAELQERQAALAQTQQELQGQLARVAEIDYEADRLRAVIAETKAALTATATIPERRAILEALDLTVICRYRDVPPQTRVFFSIELDPDGAHVWQGPESIAKLDWTKLIPPGEPSVSVEDWPIFRLLQGDPEAWKGLADERQAQGYRRATVPECMSADNSPAGWQRWHTPRVAPMLGAAETASG